MRRCALRTVKNPTAVSERTFEPNSGSLPAGGVEFGGAGRYARLTPTSQLNQVAKLKGRVGRAETAEITSAKCVVKLEGRFRIGDSSSLYAPAGRDADFTLGRRQPGVNGECSLQGAGEREGAGRFRRRSKRNQQYEGKDTRKCPAEIHTYYLNGDGCPGRWGIAAAEARLR
jgi:hypothetical protein